jgi:hypothetical protein
MATIAMQLQLDTVEGPPVITKEISVHPSMETTEPSESLFGIGGVVRDAATATAIAAATVTLDGDRTSTTDTEGRFRFSGIAAGNYTVNASAAGFTAAGKAIAVPAALINAYDIDLSP